eukprot:Skav208302  [mRNA]  locus=scaffold897:245589:252779:+ [translate_table: standard]
MFADRCGTSANVLIGMSTETIMACGRPTFRGTRNKGVPLLDFPKQEARKQRNFTKLRFRFSWKVLQRSLSIRMTRDRSAFASCQVGGGRAEASARSVPCDFYARCRMRVGVVLALLLLFACTMEVQACEISRLLGFSTDSFTASLEAVEVMTLFGIAAVTGRSHFALQAWQ